MTPETGGAGLRLGDQGGAVTALQDYLRHFGYLHPPPPDSPYAHLLAQARAPRAEPGSFDESTFLALRRFQRYARVPATGELDAATGARLRAWRCGIPDRPRGGIPLRAATDSPIVPTEGGRWSRTDLTYAFRSFTAELPEPQIRAAVADALALWSSACPLRFTETAGGDADIVIRFVARVHGDGFPFDGASGVLAHAFFPPPLGGPDAGDLHLDEGETWTLTLPVPAGAADLLTVAGHELGHALGLGHSDDPEALMYAFYKGERRRLGGDDTATVQALYGAPLRPVPGPLGDPDASADVASADLTGSGRSDLVVLQVTAAGGPAHAHYRVGRDLDAEGRVTGGWGPVQTVPGRFGDPRQGAGLTLADVTGSGRPDLVVLHADRPSGNRLGDYRVGRDLDAEGRVTGGWGPVQPLPAFPTWEGQGAAVALADLDGGGRVDLVVFHLGRPGGVNHGYVRVGRGLDAEGRVTGGWGPVQPVPGWFGQDDQPAGAALIDLDGEPGLLVFQVDRAGGPSLGRYRAVPLF